MFQQLSADADNEKAEDVSLAVKINIHNREEDDVYQEGNEKSAKSPVLEKETSEANAEDKEPLASSAGNRYFDFYGIIHSLAM